MKKVELLSPAGSMECLYQAVQNGADAVYLGGKKFGARKYASNFDYNQMVDAIKYCHLYGVKIYVTVNTIIFEEEMEEVLKYVEFLHENNVDALIVQDLGLLRLLRSMFPNLVIHASTQCHNHNSESICAMKELGVSRVVLARELSKEEIKNIEVDIEKEVFVHGALCVSYSGCCLFSSMNGGRSGNRGECVGSCRLPYELYKKEKKIKTDGKYLLSTKSLCTVEYIKDLIESGVSSFKIEGRMKSPEYVGYVTRIYRNKIDDYYKTGKTVVEEEELSNLKKLYNREFSSGYLFHSSLKNLMNIKTSNHIGVALGKVISVDKKTIKIFVEDVLNQEDGIRFDNDKGMIVNKLYNEKKELVSSIQKGKIAILDNKIGLLKAKYVRKTLDSKLVRDLNKLPARKVLVDIVLNAKIDCFLELVITDGTNTVIEYGSKVERAVHIPIEEERMMNQVSRLGNTPFECHSVIVHADDNIFIPIKELNELRRTCIDKLIEKREHDRPQPFKKIAYMEKNESIPMKKKGSLSLAMSVRNEKQLQVALQERIDSIYVDDYSLYQKYETMDNVYYRTKRTENHYKDLVARNILATELGAVMKYSETANVVSDYFLNVVNSSSVAYLLEKGVKRVTLSLESSFDNIKNMKCDMSNIEVVIYGRIELMITKYAFDVLLKEFALEKDASGYRLKKDFQHFYPITYDGDVMHIMDCKKIDFISNLKSYKDIGITHYRIELFDETELEIKNVIKEIKRKYE